MRINRIGPAHTVASTSQIAEVPTAQAPARPLHPDPPATQNKRAAIFDGLSAMPSELRQQIVNRLDLRSMARLSATSRQMAADARDGMRAFLAAHPRHDPITDFGNVSSANRLRSGLRMITHLPYPDGENYGIRLRAYSTLAQSIGTLPASERAKAFTTLAEHAGRFPRQSVLPALERLTYALIFVPARQRAEACRAMLQAAPATHDPLAPAEDGQVNEPAAEETAAEIAYAEDSRAQRAALRALPAQARLLVWASKSLSVAHFAPLAAEVAAQQPGPPARAEAVIFHEAALWQDRWRFNHYYELAADHLARSNRGEVLPHLADLSVVLPDPQMRYATHVRLQNACGELSQDDISKKNEIAVAVLLRLASALPQQPADKRVLAATSLLFQASRLDLERDRSVIVAIREQAEAVTPQVVEFRAHCDRLLGEVDSKLAEKRAAGQSFWSRWRFW